MSYTTFALDNPATDKKVYGKDDTVNLTFILKNTGKVDGAEVPQVYISQKNAPVMRPAKELKGFKKVFLKAGEQQTVTIPVNVKDMAYWNDKTNHWQVDTGDFVVSLGTSSGNIQYTLPIQVK